jgi:spermidine synthase
MKFLPAQFLFLFVLSGIAGLVHETVWARYLGIILGHSAYGQILTLIVYMGGIGLGSALAGKMSVRLANPLKAYVLVELGIGLGGFVFHPEFLVLRGFLLDSGLLTGSGQTAATIASVLVGVVLTLPFAVLIGMTYPLATAFFLRIQNDGGKDSIARLYFGNSLGAAFGALLNSYLLIPHLGTAKALMVAGTLNTGVALWAWIVLRRSVAVAPEGKRAAPTPANPSTDKPAPLGKMVWLLMASALVTGLSSFFYEIGWIRYLALLLGSSTHAFDLMVSAFILGLAGGAWTVHRSQGQDLTKALVVAQIGMAGAAVLGVVAYEPIFRAANQLNVIFMRTSESYPFYNFARYIFCLVVMLPASWFAGMTLPLICRLLLASGENESTTGKVYAWNTLGAILGAAIGGLVLMPSIGLFRLVGVGAAIDLALACWLMIKLMPQRPRLVVGFAVASAALVVCALVIQPKNNIVASGLFRGFTPFRAYDEDKLIHGRTASIHISRQTDRVVLTTNGKPDASIRLKGVDKGASDELTQSLLGWIGRAYSSVPYRAAMIGMGSGQTANTLLEDARCQSLDLIEIEPAVYEQSKWFFPKNRRVYEDPRIQVHFQDARIFFARQKERYDLVLSEPSNPWVSGVSSLFTDEFYSEMNSRLSERGLLVQWLHSYESSQEVILSILKTIRKNFKHVALLSLANPYDFYIVASNAPINPKPQLTGTYDSALLAINFLSQKDIGVGLEVIHEDAIDLATEAIPLNSEFNPYLDAQAERAFFLKKTASFVQEMDAGNLSLDVISRPVLLAGMFASPQRRSLLARSIPLEENYNRVLDKLSKPGPLSPETRKFALHQFRTTIPAWTWWLPDIQTMVDGFRLRLDSLNDTSAEASLFRWSWYLNRGQHKGAAAELVKAMQMLPGDLTLENFRDLYAYLIVAQNYPMAGQIRVAASEQHPMVNDRADFDMLDRLLKRKSGMLIDKSPATKGE